MSFRQFGGLNYAPKHNIVGSNYNTANNLQVTQNVGQSNSFINFLSDISSNNINVGSNLNVGGNLDVSDNVVVSNNLVVGGNFDVSGNINFDGNLDVSNNLFVRGNLDVSGNANFESNINVLYEMDIFSKNRSVLIFCY